MKNKYKVRARFAREVRFNVDPVPLYTRQTTELEKLKDQLLREMLEPVIDPAQNTALRRAANDSAALAWATPYPLLVFPALFAERARVALAHAWRQAGVRRRSSSLLLKAA